MSKIRYDHIKLEKWQYNESFYAFLVRVRFWFKWKDTETFYMWYRRVWLFLKYQVVPVRPRRHKTLKVKFAYIRKIVALKKKTYRIIAILIFVPIHINLIGKAICMVRLIEDSYTALSFVHDTASKLYLKKPEITIYFLPYEIMDILVLWDQLNLRRLNRPPREFNTTVQMFIVFNYRGNLDAYYNYVRVDFSSFKVITLYSILIDFIKNTFNELHKPCHKLQFSPLTTFLMSYVGQVNTKYVMKQFILVIYSNYIKLGIYKTLLTYILITLLYVLIGGAIPLLERKYLSLIQRRIGPKFVGYNGRMQILADALKLLFKEMIILKNTNSILFLIIPINLLVLNLVICYTIVWGNIIYTIPITHSIFILLIIELITTIFTTYIGIITKNKYTLITSVRIINGTVVFEIFILTVLSYFYIIYDSNTFINTLYQPLISLKLQYFWLLTGIFMYAVLLILKKVPFDIIEAETELIMGYTTEHSGFLSGALILVEYLHLFFWSYFTVVVFIL